MFNNTPSTSSQVNGRSCGPQLPHTFCCSPAAPASPLARRQPYARQERGAAIGYQGRKAGRTTNALFLADDQGLPLAVVTPQAGNQHDSFEVERVFAELCELLEAAELHLDGLFLNADKAFDVSSLRQACTRRGIEANIPRNRRSADWQTDDDTPLDPALYQCRLAIERLNAWLDGFKTLLVRYETSLQNWLAV